MIRKVELENYRCYKKHTIEFSDLSIVVGKNNAGKSTLIESLRLVALVVNRYKKLPYKTPPSWIDLPKRYYGVSPSLKGIEISPYSIFHKNEAPPAKITVYFHNKSKIELFIGEESQLYASIFDEVGDIITNKQQALAFSLPVINILPQIGPLRNEEKLLAEDYIQSNIFSNLASLHFRNQLQYYFNEYYYKFKKLAESSWEQLKILGLDHGSILDEKPPMLLIENEGFASEVGLVGHGLQMWLQTMWFIARCDTKTTIILDEPDVYLHADMQRKLIKLLKGKFKQTIIATHSIEIISEVVPENILVIDKKNRNSKFLMSLPAMQEIIDCIGSIQNLELIRYWSARKFLFLEGPKDDIKIMQIFQKKIHPQCSTLIDIIPKAYTGGWTGWQKVLGANMAIRKSGITVSCIFDSDYHTKEKIEKRYEEARENNIDIHIWKKKEIENYLIIPEAILRVLLSAKDRRGAPTLEILRDQMQKIADCMKVNVIDCYAEHIHLDNAKWSVTTCSQKARKIVDEQWKGIDKILSCVSGKEFLAKLSEWSKKEFNVSFSKFNIAEEIEIEEIEEELKTVLSMLEN